MLESKSILMTRQELSSSVRFNNKQSDIRNIDTAITKEKNNNRELNNPPPPKKKTTEN